MAQDDVDGLTPQEQKELEKLLKDLDLIARYRLTTEHPDWQLYYSGDQKNLIDAYKLGVIDSFKINIKKRF